MKKIAIVGIASSLLLSGCATRDDPALQAKIRLINESVPICKTDKECEVKWSAARQWVLSNAGFKLQHIQPDFLETYNSVGSSVYLAARVVKEPIAEGGYKIVAALWCDNWMGCSPDKWDALLDFNTKVNAAWKSS